MPYFIADRMNGGHIKGANDNDILGTRPGGQESGTILNLSPTYEV